MARRRPSTVHGVVAVDKPAGMTSHDVVGIARRQLDERRIGHSGTLTTPILLGGITSGQDSQLFHVQSVFVSPTLEISLGGNSGVVLLDASF